MSICRMARMEVVRKKENGNEAQPNQARLVYHCPSNDLGADGVKIR